MVTARDPDQPEPDRETTSDGDVEGELSITNEFTTVRVRKVRTRNGERLEISSLRVPHQVRLDALVLESLTWRPFEELAKGLETPFGADPGPGGTEGGPEA